MNLPQHTRHAVILAAGLGSRLLPLTIDRPKPLVEVHGTSILHNALRILASVGVEEVTIVVGYRKETIERACGREFAGLKINYVPSAVFDRTGSAYSLWLARESLLREDSLLLEGDVFFERAVLTRLLASDHPNVGAIAPFTEDMSGSAVTLAENQLVQQMLMNQSASSRQETPLYKTMNLYRFTAEALRDAIVPALDREVVQGHHKAYVEQVLSPLLGASAFALGAVSCGDLKWFEIDSYSDLRIAERLFSRETDPPAALLGAGALAPNF